MEGSNEHDHDRVPERLGELVERPVHGLLEVETA